MMRRASLDGVAIWMMTFLEKAAAAEGESAELDFRATFDRASTGDWCELVKNIVAFANSGGGS
jgi:hypothetical protein